jgi:hypothetical protein
MTGFNIVSSGENESNNDLYTSVNSSYNGEALKLPDW